MHAKHRILLKKNAKRIAHTDGAQDDRAFYFALDKSRDKGEQEILHIDKKIKQSGKFNNIKKLNRTLEPFGDDDYQLDRKSRMCAGMVSRSIDGALIFDVQIKKGIGAGQLARALKKFKRLIGASGVFKDGEALSSDAAGDALKSVDHYLEKLAGLLAEFTASRSTGASISEDGALRSHSLAEEQLVERCQGALYKCLEAAQAAAGEAEADEAERTLLARSVQGQTLEQWLITLEDWTPWIAGGASDEDDPGLAAEIAAELREANLDDALSATEDQAIDGVSYFLLQQQEMFRNNDAQVDPVLSADELSLSRDGEALEMTEDLLRQSGLSKAFTLEDGQLRLKDFLLEDGVISAQNRAKLAGLLVKATALGFDLHMSNPSAGDDGAQIELSASEDGTFTQLIDRRRVASASNLMFDRRQEIVPGTTPPQTFLELTQAMNHADAETFAQLNDMLKDAWQLDQTRGLVAGDMSFRDYKMQFVDLEIGGVDESGLRWHDNTGALGAEEWAFLALKVNDLPERTQNNYYVEISWKGGSKPIERKLDINCDSTRMKALLDAKNTAAVTTWLYDGLADEEWSRSGLGVAPGDKAGLIAAYRKFPINIKMGFWDNSGSLTWEYKDGFRPALINTMSGKDELVPLVNDISEGALRTLLTDEDGNLPTGEDGQPLDLSSEDGLASAQELAVDSMSDVVMSTAMTAWAENSTEAIGDLLKPIPDTQKVFLRQSNGTVNSVRIANTDIRGALDTMGRIPELASVVEQLRRIITQPGVTAREIKKVCRQVRDIARGLGLEPDEVSQVKAALKTITDADIKDVGQTDVINEGNDTGAFGKCAPTSYFCASLCGVSQAARDGFDLLQGGGPELRKASKKLEQMFSSGAMTEERRQAIVAQIAQVERLVQDAEAQRDEAKERLFSSPEWEDLVEDYQQGIHDAFEQQQVLLEERRNMDPSDEAGVAALTKQIRDLDKSQIELRRVAVQQLNLMYDEVLGDVEAQLADRKRGLERVKTLKESIVDRMVVHADDTGPYMDMSFPIPQSAFDRSAGDYSGGWLVKKVESLRRETGKPAQEILAELGCREDPEKGWVMDVKVRPEDIQEYLEQTNREDKYRGGKKHMMDFFKDPSSMNNIQLMKSLGPGLIAVGLDKGLKMMGKDSGLLYGPSGDVVATMVYNDQRTSEYGSISRKMPDKFEKEPDGSIKLDEDGNKVQSAAYQQEFSRRRASIIDKLKRSQEDGGSCSVSMGYSSANGHVNYVQAWGTPSVDGVEISSDDVARCRMNLVENAASSSAWNNDRVQEFPINTAAMGRGLDGIIEKMRAAGKGDTDPRLAELLALKATADEATAAFDAIAEDVGGAGMTGEKLAQLRSSGLNKYWARIEEITDGLKAELTETLEAEGKTPDEIEAALKAKEKEFKDASSGTAWKELSKDEQVAINRWNDAGEHPDFEAALDKIRKASADTSDWLKAKMAIKHGDDDLNSENILIMPSNTERDNRVTDTEEDVAKVGGGNIGSQKRGSANATDASYFVPINALASGWDGEVTDDPDDPENKNCSASRYNYSDDPRDQFVMLSSFTTMLSEAARRR